jgi:type II secretory pathway pseudopilin PulG
MPKSKSQAGFSLLELVAVIAIVMVLAGMAIVSITSSSQHNKANAAMDAVVTQLRYGRQLAITMRRNVMVTFTAPNQIQLAVQTLPGEAPGTPIAPVFLNDNARGGAQFLVFAGLPDVPGGVGNMQPLTFVPASGGSAGLSLMFNSSGTFIGTTATSNFASVGNNNPVNGTIFIGVPGQRNTARAITVLGGTGRVRTYYYTGTSWQE